jgi:hypothetical protein
MVGVFNNPGLSFPKSHYYSKLRGDAICISKCLLNVSQSIDTVSSSSLSFFLSFFLYGSAALWTLAAFSVSCSCTQSVGLLWRGISPYQGRYLHMTTQTQNKRTQTSMPRLGYEPTIPVFERTKTAHALDRADTLTSSSNLLDLIFSVLSGLCINPRLIIIAPLWLSTVVCPCHLYSKLCIPIP